MAAASCSIFPAISSLSSSSTISQARGPNYFFHCPNFFRTNFGSISTLKPLIARRPVRAPKFYFVFKIVSCVDNNHFEAHPEAEPTSVPNDSHKEATVDLELPRRSLLVQFSCNACGERTQRLINRLAYERGTVFVQCAGCFKHHKLVDNLALVVEYDLREDIEMDENADQV